MGEKLGDRRGRRKDSFELCDEGRQILVDGLPDDVQIDIEVTVDEPIAHSRHLVPSDSGV